MPEPEPASQDSMMHLTACSRAVTLMADKARFVPGTSLRTIESRPFPGAPVMAVFFVIEQDGRCGMLELAISGEGSAT